jgi:hypothetical protein
LIAAATLIPIAALGRLAVSILQQDRDLEGQRRLERLKYAGGRLALAAEGRLASIEEQLAQGRGVRFGPGGLDPAEGSIILYQPGLKPGRKLPESVFAGAETLEYQRKDLPGAAKEYRRLAEAPDAALRAEALVRLGAVLRNQHDREGALRRAIISAGCSPASVGPIAANRA